MRNNKEHLYSIEHLEAIIENPAKSWRREFKEIIISMIASNTNELLWYANFLSRCEYEFHFNESFTSAVYFNGQNFVMAINPLILGIISKEEIIAILKHNAGHIINSHFSRGHYDKSVDKEIIATAKDIVINGSRELPYIKDLPRTGEHTESPIMALFYETLTEKYAIKEYEIGREFEYYVELIMTAQELSLRYTDENQSCSDSSGQESDETEISSGATQEANEEESLGSSEQNDSDDQTDEAPNSAPNSLEEGDSFENSGENERSEDMTHETNLQSDSLIEKTLQAVKNGECSMDSHEFGEHLQESIGLEQTLLESFQESTLSEMILDATGFSRGFTPGDAIEALSRIQKRKSHKDWRKILNKRVRNYFSNSLRFKEPNKSRQHPLYPDDFDLYGYSLTKKPKIAVVLDVSGSVDEKLFIELISQIQAIQKKYSIKTLTLVQVDAQIKSVEKLGVADKFVIRSGNAGTIMEPGFELLLKQSKRNLPDIIICATDGDVETHFERLKIPTQVEIIWLVEKAEKLRFDMSAYPKNQMHLIEFSP